MKEQFKNASSTTLAAAITDPAATTITVASASALPASPQFRLIVDTEVMLVTAIAGNVLTVVRGAEGTTAATHAIAAAVTHILTVASLIGLGLDNDPFFNGARQPFALLAADGSTLTSADFTAHNDAGDSHTPIVSDSDRRIRIKRLAGSVDGASEALCLLSRPAPATPYTVTACLQPNVVAASYQFSVDVGFREASSGKSLLLRIPYFTGAPDEAFINTAVNEAGVSLVTTVGYYVGGLLWFQLSDDGTNLTISMSNNGVDFVPVYTAARTANFTAAPDQVAWGCGAHANAFDAYCSLLSWSE